jgi:hypothetical protein
MTTGDEVVVVEHYDGSPREDGERHPAKVAAAEGIYLHVDYDDKSVHLFILTEAHDD